MLEESSALQDGRLWRVRVGAVRRPPQAPPLKGTVRSEGRSEKERETLKADSHSQGRRGPEDSEAADPRQGPDCGEQLGCTV